MTRISGQVPPQGNQGKLAKLFRQIKALPSLTAKEKQILMKALQKGSIRPADLGSVLKAIQKGSPADVKSVLKDIKTSSKVNVEVLKIIDKLIAKGSPSTIKPLVNSNRLDWVVNPAGIQRGSVR